MPNHYSNTVLLYIDAGRDFDLDDDEALAQMLVEHFSGALSRLAPCPKDLRHGAACDWSRKNWGTKWDTYDVEAARLPGDGWPFRVSFCTAWTPPNDGMRRRLLAEAEGRFAKPGARWLGLNPFDDSAHDLTPTAILAMCDAAEGVEETRERAVFEAGYGIGYGNGREDGRCDEFNPSPGQCYELWKAGPQSGAPFGDVDEQGIRALVQRTAGELLHDLLTAAQAPEGVDVVEWVGACSQLGLSASDAPSNPSAFQEALDRVRDLRTPPAPLPTKADWWWGRWDEDPQEGWRPVRVEDRLEVGVLAGACRFGSRNVWCSIDAERWTWLAGPDGKAVRVEPPEGVTP